MALVQEYELSNLMLECSVLLKKVEEKDAETALLSRVDRAYSILSRNVRDTFANFSHDIIVQFCQISIQTPKKQACAQEFVQYFFDRAKQPTQFYVRALLVRARIIAMNGQKSSKKAEDMLQVLKESLQCVNKALDVISKGGDPKDKDPGNKLKYNFLIYNASVCVYNILRFMLRPNWQRNFTDIVDRIYKLFEEVDEQDFNWRYRYGLILFQCLYDADKKADAFKLFDVLFEKCKAKGVEFTEYLFRLKIQLSKENKAFEGSIKKDIETPEAQEKAWKVLEVIQKIKSGLIAQSQTQKELINLINSITPAVLSGNDIGSAAKIKPVMQERLAEISRVALKQNLVNIAENVTNFLSRVRQFNQRAYIMNEYNKAQLLVKKPGSHIDTKTGMRYNSIQIKMQQIQRRNEALRILQKAMTTNRKLNDPDLITEGALLVWNLSLPLMNPVHRPSLIKVFQAAASLLELIQSNDHALRVKFHLELAKIELIKEDFIYKAQQHIAKALALDPSIPVSKLTVKVQAHMDNSLYQRPLEKYLKFFQQKIKLKRNSMEGEKTPLKRVIIDLQNVRSQKSQNTKTDILQKCLGNLVTLEELQFVPDPKKELVQEELKAELIKHKQRNAEDYKTKKLLAAEIAELAFEWQFNQVAIKACQFVINDTWQPLHAPQMIAAQIKCLYQLAQISIDALAKMNYQVAFEQPSLIDPDQETPVVTGDQAASLLKQKRYILSLYQKSVRQARSIGQSWLIFNGAIYIWNNFLPIFRNPSNDSKLLPEIQPLMKQFFDAMMTSLKDLQKKQYTDYDIDTKIQIFANIGLIYARLVQQSKQFDEISRICDALLLAPLSPHTRKLINSIKARNTPKNAGGKGGDKTAAKGGSQSQSGGNTDSFLFDIVSQLQIIENSQNKAEIDLMMKKCFQTLQNWKLRENDQTELEIHAELWVRLAKLALQEQTASMYKYSLRCVQHSLSLLPTTADIQSIPQSRLRWYSLAQFLYSENLLKILNTDTQQTQATEKLLFHALNHAVEAAHKGFRANISSLLLDAAKQVWNISAKLQYSFSNRKLMIKPLFSTMFYLRSMKERSQPDLTMLLSQLLFKGALQNGQFSVGQNVADMALQLLPKASSKLIWQAKMIFLSKQGKNELQAIANMKQAGPSLQAKVWIRMARASTSIHKQQSAYSKAIQIMQKETSVQIVQILIEYAQWLLRNGQKQKQLAIGFLQKAADVLLDIQLTQQEQFQDNQTIFSRSTRGKISVYSKSKKDSRKQNKTLSNQKLIKKNNEAKSVVSITNKSLSRLSRPMRTVKATKSKQSKSIFTQREEDPNPEGLNCAHYQRLMRIHTMLALMEGDQQARIQLALDGKLFILKIFEVSFRTLNQQEQNAAKYNNIEQRKDKQEKDVTFVPKYLMPGSVDDWIKLQFSKEFIQKANAYQDYDFISVYLFDKPQLTFVYAKHLLSIFQSLGMYHHALPILIFLKFLTKQILKNNLLHLSCELRFCRCLRGLGYLSQSHSIISSLSLQKLKLSDHEKKINLVKTESSKGTVTHTTPSVLTQNLVKPNLIKPFVLYQVWFELAKELFLCQEVSRAKEYFLEVKRHLQILEQKDLLGEVLSRLAHIAYLQGEFQQSISYLQEANNKITRPAVWSIAAPIIPKSLKKLGRPVSINRFLQKLSGTLQDPPEGMVNQPSSYLQLRVTYLLLRIKQEVSQLKLEYNQDKVKGLRQLFKIFIENTRKSLLYEHLVNLQKITDSLLALANRLDPNKAYKLLAILIPLLQKIDQVALTYCKYTLVMQQKNQFINNPLNIQTCRLRVILSRALCFQGQIKFMLRQKVEQADGQPFEQQPQMIKTFIQKLNNKINDQMAGPSKRLAYFEKAAALLTGITSKLPHSHQLHREAFALLVRAKRLIAWKLGFLEKNWSSNKPVQNESMLNSKAGSESLLQAESALELGSLGDPRLDGEMYLQILENFGQLFPQRSFQCLAMVQHYKFVERAELLLRHSLKNTNRFIVQKRSKSLVRTFCAVQPAKLSPINDLLNLYPAFSEATFLAPSNSVTIILQLRANLNQLYLGMMGVNSGRQFRFEVRRHVCEMSELRRLVQSVKVIGNKLIKTPIVQVQQYENLVSEQEKLYQNFKIEFQNFFSFLKKDVIAFVGQGAQARKPPQDKAKAAKKGTKDQAAPYESSSPVTDKGVESVCLLLDEQLFYLPMESLSFLREVGCISRQNSLGCLFRKYKDLNFKAEVNNSVGISKDRIKYIFYQLKPDNDQLLAEKAAETVKTLKLEGISTTKKVASLGDWQKNASTASVIQVFSSQPILSILGNRSLSTLLQVNKSKLWLIIDRINAKKSWIKKFNCLSQEGESVALMEQAKTLSLWSGILNVNLFVNNWCHLTPYAFSFYKEFCRYLSQQIYLGSILNKINNPQKLIPVQVSDKDKKGTKLEEDRTSERKPLSLIAKDMFLFVGAPHLRLNGSG